MTNRHRLDGHGDGIADAGPAVAEPAERPLGADAHRDRASFRLSGSDTAVRAAPPAPLPRHLPQPTPDRPG
ncbi:MAG: hypothetical protein HOQ24_13510, partial [Mycobacteriaceae bacterium]|nr:hypothetical protein [Mycobacteriaceae bacterium]